jgi:Ser/Thr protein kinase RdoA (MazF antagonist)
VAGESGPIAEAALARRHGGPVRLDLVETITEDDRRNEVSRYRVVEGPPSLPSTVIVKLRQGDVPPDGLRRDIAANRLLTEQTDVDVAPALLGWDGGTSLMVLEDVGDGESLVEALLGDDAAQAEGVLLAAAASLGRLHGATIGKADVYRTIFREVNGGKDADAGDPDLRLKTISKTLNSLDMKVTQAFRDEFFVVHEAWRGDGPLLALVHNDPCPDNWRLIDGRVKLFDFEFAQGFGIATIDAAYPRMQFPTCWCAGRSPRRVVDAFEAKYRATLAQRCEAALDDAVWAKAMLGACAGWFAFWTLDWQLRAALKEDKEWGISRQRPRILGRIDALLEACDKFGRLPAFEALAHDLRAKLVTLWPETRPLSLYPAFRGLRPE